MAKTNFIKFKLTKDRKPVSFQVPVKGMMLKNTKLPNSPLKHVQYIPGHESIWKEDHTGDEQPQSIWFEDGFLNVHKNNLNLLKILERHQWFGIHFIKVDEEAEDAKELEKFELIEKAISKVNIANEDELKANAIILIGSHVFDYSEVRLRKALKQMAYDTPEKLIESMDKANYGNRLVAALSIIREAAKINPSRTAVTWPDGKTIINIAVGKDPITEFGEYLSQNTEAVRITLQTLGEGIKRAYNQYNPPNVDTILGNDPEPPSEEEQALNKAREDYKKKFEKEVPTNKKNDIGWIKSKLEEEPIPA